MTAFLIRRTLATIPVLLGVLFLVFMMLHLVPGDPVKIMLSQFQTNPQQIARLRSQLHLNKPLPEQFGIYLWDAVHGNLGYSIADQRPVSTDIAQNLPSTLELAVAGMLIAAFVGVTLGILAAVKQNSWADIGSMFFAMLGVSMPSFWLGLLLILAFSLRVHWFPATGGEGFRSIVLPALTLGLGASAIIARLTRSSMLEVLHQDYVRTARAKGVREIAVIVRHTFRNALIPVITIFGLQFGQVLAGTVVIETVFSRPGIGSLIVNAIMNKDYPLVQGIVLVIALSYVIVNLLVDLTYIVLDPRIRYS